MEPIPIVVKHQGNKYNVEVDPDSVGELLKFQLYSLTGVEPTRQKIVIRGQQLKDDTDMSKLGLKSGQTIIMIGSASGGTTDLVPPKQPVRFVEDMTESEAAHQAGAVPAGLVNLGNTCYLNATLQALRSVGELRDALTDYSGSGSDGAGSSAARGGAGASGAAGLGSSAAATSLSTALSTLLGSRSATGDVDLTGQLRDLFQNMGATQNSLQPMAFLNALRLVFPQFAERNQSGPGYAQQDAEECWSQIVQTLQTRLEVAKKGAARSDKPKAEESSQTGQAAGQAAVSAGTGSQSATTDGAKNESGEDGKSANSFVGRYMAGSFSTTVVPLDADAVAAGEEPVTTTEPFFKLSCHIDTSSNHLRDGLVASLRERVTKHSDVLDRDDVGYERRAAIARLPKYLAVHFVRFFWRRDVQKKVKIMRKVTFPRELDVVDLCDDTLKAKLMPVRDQVREIRKEEEDAERMRKRRKRSGGEGVEALGDGAKGKGKEKDKKEAGRDSTAAAAAAPDEAKDVEMKDADDKDVDVTDTAEAGPSDAAESKAATAATAPTDGDPEAADRQEKKDDKKEKSEKKEKKEKKEKTDKKDKKDKKDRKDKKDKKDKKKNENVEHKTDAQVDAERTASLQAMKRKLHSLVDAELAADAAGNPSGLYQLQAIITHQGASADGGHYTAYVKKSAAAEAAGAPGSVASNDNSWWWFNDDRVSEVEDGKIEGLSGGGESHSALILLYRAIALPEANKEDREAKASE